MIFWGRIACAVGILRRGQEKGEARSGDYGQALRRTHGAKFHGPADFALAGAVRLAIDPLDRSLYRLTVAALDRCPRIALRAAPCGSPRQRETQTFLSQKIML
jgi:hypothetical protein